jgi:hypothetical protein
MGTETDVTVVAFAWSGARPIYTAWQAVNMQTMMRKHLRIPHRFVIVTDDVPAMEAAGLDAVPIWAVPDIPATRAHWLRNYVRLGVMDPAIGGALGSRVLSIDLDAIVRADITDLVEGPEPFRIMRLMSRQQVQGALFRVDPGRFDVNPWDMLLRDSETNIIDRSRAWVGSDQAILSELFFRKVEAGELPCWTEADGMSINRLRQPGWRVFFRTGPKKCWNDGVPERDIYLYESGRADVPPSLPVMRGSHLAVPIPRRKTIQRIVPRQRVRAPQYKVLVPSQVAPLGRLRYRSETGGDDGNK